MNQSKKHKRNYGEIYQVIQADWARTARRFIGEWREKGVTYEILGKVMGVSRQAVHQRDPKRGGGAAKK